VNFLKKAWKKWRAFGQMMGDFVARIFMTVFYFTLAIPFGIVSLLVTFQTVNIFSGLGLLLLFGVVKKNAILQIDRAETLEEARRLG